MKLLLPLLAFTALAIVGCAERADCPDCKECPARAANQNAAAEAEKSFDKENPAQPEMLAPAPAK